MTKTMMRRRATRTTVAAVTALTMIGGVVAADEQDVPTQSIEVVPEGDAEPTEEIAEEQPEWKRIKREGKLGWHELRVAIMAEFHAAKEAWIAECAEAGDPSSDECKASHDEIKEAKKAGKAEVRAMRAEAKAAWKAAKEAHKLALLAERDPEKAAERAEKVAEREQRKAERDAAKAERDAAKAERKAAKAAKKSND